MTGVDHGDAVWCRAAARPDHGRRLRLFRVQRENTCESVSPPRPGYSISYNIGINKVKSNALRLAAIANRHAG